MLAAIGVVMWGIGSRIIRVVFLSLGLFAGALLGWIAGDLLPAGVGLPGWMVPVLGALVLGIVAVVTCRLAIAVTLAVALGLAVPLGGRALLDMQPAWFDLPAAPEEAEPPDLIVDTDAEIPAPVEERDELDAWLDAIAGTASGDAPAPVTDAAVEVATDAARTKVEERLGEMRAELGLDPETTRTALERIRDTFEPQFERAKEWWRDTPRRMQPILIALAAAAALAGALVGSLVPNVSAAIVTTLAGSVLWMTTGSALLWDLGVPAPEWWPRSPTAWIVWWLAVSIIGLFIHWTLRSRRADKSA